MKKILFVCDGGNFPEGAFRFIKLLHSYEPVFLKGIFFSPVDIEQIISLSYVPVSQPWVRFKEEEKQMVKESVEKFSHQCDNARIRYAVQDTEDSWDKHLFIKESRFADLIVISEELFCLYGFGEQPNYFMQEALRGAECPVVVIPETFVEIERLAVAYDGKKESMFALKQFSQLLTQFNELPTEFLYIKAEDNDDIPDKDLLKEYAQWHFNSLAETKLHFDAKKYFPAWLEDKKNVMLIAGSYSRSGLSNAVNRSFTERVIHNRACPVFIAHA